MKWGVSKPNRALLLLAFLFGVSGCISLSPNKATSTVGTAAGSSSGTPIVAVGGPHFQISWTANREAAVNRSGGGYLVYISNTSGASLGSITPIQVPYVSGSSAPTSLDLQNLSPGTYYVRVVAYSAMTSTAHPTGSSSQASSEIAFVVQ